MICFQHYKVRYLKFIRHKDPFSKSFEWLEDVEVEEDLQFVKSTNCFYEFYNKATGKRFKIRKDDVVSYEIKEGV